MYRALSFICLFPLVAASQTATGSVSSGWRHMVGSNSDELWVANVSFYRQGTLVDASTNRSAGFFGAEGLKDKDYRWSISKGRYATRPIPDQVYLEWVSFHDKKRYSISLTLPTELKNMIAQRYRVKVGKEWREERRKNIVLGMATGGYVEVFLTSLRAKPDILLARGIAKDVTNAIFDQNFPLSSQYKNAWADFDAKYSKAYQQYPVPTGMAWAPIMDAYRAAQPKTDTDPLN